MPALAILGNTMFLIGFTHLKSQIVLFNIKVDKLSN